MSNDEMGHPKQRTQPVEVIIETNTCVIEGTVHPPAIAYRGRLSDLLNQKGSVFLNVTDATVYCPRDAGEASYTTPYIAVNLNSIDIVRPVGEE